MINATIKGRLGKDAKLITKEDGNSFAVFPFAVDKSYKDRNGQKVDRTRWFDCTIKGKRAEAVAKHLSKGKEIVIITNDIFGKDFEKKDGSQGFAIKIPVIDIVFCGSKSDSDSDNNSNNSNGQSQDDMPF